MAVTPKTFGRNACALLAATALAVTALALAPTGARASTSQWSIFEDHPYLVQTSEVTRERTLDEIQELGADTLRVEVKWNEVAPSPNARTKPAFDASNPSAYPGFGPYDAVIQSAVKRKLRVLITITGDAPRWATAGGRGGNYKPSAAEYARFAAAVGARYSGTYSGLPKVIFFTIWNEPNHIQFIKPTAQAPRVYRALVDAGVPALRAKAAPEAKIFVGELKPTPRRGLGPLTFLREWLCLDAKYKKLRGKAARSKGCTTFKKIKASGFAHHPYGPVGLVSKKQDIVNLLAIKRLAQALDLAAKANRIPRGLGIYNTEYGIQTNPPDIFVSTSLARHAKLINEKEEFAYRYSRLKSHSQYQLHDDPARSGPPAVRWSGFQTGLRFADGRKKPAWDAYRFPLVVKKSKGKVVVWGRVRPGSGARFAQVQKLTGGKWVDSGGRVGANPLGYFQVEKTPGTYRFAAYARPLSASSVEMIGTSRAASPSK